MAFAPTPAGTRGWEEGRRLCGAKPGQGPRPHAALHGARFANGILWVCTELLWFPPSPRTGGSPRAQVRAIRSPWSPSCPLSQLGPAPGRTQTPSTTSPPHAHPLPVPQTPSWGLFCLGELLERGKGACVGARSSSVLGQRPHLQHRRRVPMAGEGTGRLPAEPRDGAQQGTRPPHPAAPLRVPWCQVPCQRDVPPQLGSAPSPPAGAFQGFPRSVGTAPRASRHRRDTLGTAQAVQDPRSDPGTCAKNRLPC